MTTVTSYLTSMDTLRRMNDMGDKDWKFFSVEALILHYGRTFTPAPLPKDIRRGKRKECFQNAINIAAWDTRWAYCEGYAVGMIPTMHAWFTDRRAGTLAFDATWEDGHAQEYFGIAFNSKWAVETMVDTGVYGIFGGCNPDLLVELLTNGLPAEALA